MARIYIPGMEWAKRSVLEILRIRITKEDSLKFNFIVYSKL